MSGNTYVYIFLMALVTYAVRVLPMTLIRKPIKSTFIKSFLYYVPYVTLSVMTFPAIIEATRTPIAGIAALIIGAVLAYFGAGLFKVTAASCVIVLIIELILVR